MNFIFRAIETAYRELNQNLSREKVYTEFNPEALEKINKSIKDLYNRLIEFSKQFHKRNEDINDLKLYVELKKISFEETSYFWSECIEILRKQENDKALYSKELSEIFFKASEKIKSKIKSSSGLLYQTSMWKIQAYLLLFIGIFFKNVSVLNGIAIRKEKVDDKELYSDEGRIRGADTDEKIFPTGKPQRSEISQNSIADCHLLAPLISLVNYNPEAIIDCFPQYKSSKKNFETQEIIKIRFFELEAKDVKTFSEKFSFNCVPTKPIIIKVNKTVIKAGNRMVAKALWVNLIEKAYAKYIQLIKYKESNSNGLAFLLDYGDPEIALAAITGKETKRYYAMNEKISCEKIKKKLSKGMAVTACIMENAKFVNLLTNDFKDDVVIIEEQHICSILEAGENVTLGDPHGKIYEITWEDFFKYCKIIGYTRKI